MEACTINNCDNKIYARSWCRRHYRHVVEGGHPQPLPIYKECQISNCNEKLSGHASSSGLCKAHYMEKWKQETDWDPKTYSKEYNQKNKKRIAKQCKEWKANNRKRENAWYAEKRKDPQYRLAHNQRSRIYDALKGKTKHKNTMDLIGLSIAELMNHLESKFQPGMTRDNYGTYWVVDHVIPMIAFDLEIPEQLEKACHYSNLQPLTYAENSSKATEDKKWKN